MAIFNITSNLLNAHAGYDPYNRDPITLRSAFKDIREWLEDNVGEFYGPGDDNVIYIGAGWEMFKLYDGQVTAHPYSDTSVTWHVDITDEAKAVHFALTWSR
jgi:hypothetical protein